MKPEEVDVNHFKYIVIEQLQSKIKLVKESTIPNKDECIEKIIQNFLEEFKDNELVNLTSSEQVKCELKKLEERQKVKKTRDEDDGR